ncbi:MAG: hypothetical protein CENE_02449 [Candidatus Celerinatantimonas neptuna]|nr:MAG: hypothetical protein CENE_02449 [Candidatus Celerinatantimonas neptuna]
MNNNDLSTYLAEADQSVRDFLTVLFEKLNMQRKLHHDPIVRLEYFSLIMEIRLLSYADGDRKSLDFESKH